MRFPGGRKDIVRGVFPLVSRDYRDSRAHTPDRLASSRDIVGLIWRSGINQRANILRGPGNAAGAAEVFLSAT